MKLSDRKYNSLLKNISYSVEQSRLQIIQKINTDLVKAYWEIGRHIVEFEQHGNQRAEYGDSLLARLSKDLTLLHGKGFGRRNVLDMRRFYIAFSKWQAVPAKLSWTHFVALIGIDDKHARSFYAKQSVIENWSYRELERQINSSLFERLALSRDKKGVLALERV